MMENKKSKIWWLVGAAAIIIGLALVLKFYAGASTIIWNISAGGKWLLPLVSITALVDSLNPCAFSILILTSASLLIALGLINLLQELFPNSPVKLRLPQLSHGLIARVMAKASVPAAFILGGLVGLCEFPCTGGPYLMILGLLHDQVPYFSGLGYLFLYNLIFVLPLVIILALASQKSLLDRIEDWQNRRKKLMRRAGGLAMVALGLIILLI